MGLIKLVKFNIFCFKFYEFVLYGSKKRERLTFLSRSVSEHISHTNYKTRAYLMVVEDA